MYNYIAYHVKQKKKIKKKSQHINYLFKINIKI